MLPTAMLLDKPLRPAMASPGKPHKGAMRGNSMNSTSMMGAPNSVMPPDKRAACHSVGRPCGRCASTKVVSSPHSASNMLAAVSSDCE